MSFYFWPDLAARQARTSDDAPYESGYYPDVSVSWLWTQRFGNAWLRAMAREKDRLFELTRDSILCRFPSTAPSDALPLVGFDRNIVRGFGESDDSYRQRLSGAWSFWKWSGTALGIVVSMQPSGFVGIPWTSDEVEFDPYYPTTSSSVFVIRNADVAPGSLLDGLQFWSRFWVYIDSAAESITFDGDYDDPGDYDDGGVWDLDEMAGELITPSMIGSWKAAIRQSKPAEWSCAAICVGGLLQVPAGEVQIPMDSTDLSLGIGVEPTFTRTGNIIAAATWSSSVSMASLDYATTFFDVSVVVRCGSASAWLRRTVAVKRDSTMSAWAFVGAASPTSGCSIAEESSGIGFDVRFLLVGRLLSVQAMGPAAGVFTVNYREVVL